MIYCIDETLDEPIMLINSHIGYDDEDGMGIDGNLFQKELLYLDTLGKKRIQVWINSIGGVVLDGYSIGSTILKTKTPVDTYNVGIAASIAGAIFMCGRNRIAMDFSQFMMHPVSGSEDKKGYKSFMDSISMLLSAKSNMTQEEVSQLMTETTWLTAEECLEKGICTEIEKTANVNKKRLSTANIDNFLREANLITNKFLKTKNKKSMLKVTNKLGLNDDANEESILKAIQEMENKAMTAKEKIQAEMDALKEKMEADNKAFDELKAKFEATKDDACKNMVTEFAKVGKIANDEAIINKWAELAKNDFEGTKELLEAIPVNKVANKIETSNTEVREPQVGDYMNELLRKFNNKK
jgi:ATP-dependent protease ClpP protease subunit